MRLAVIFLAFLGFLTAQEIDECPGKKSATLVPSFTMTPTATESTTSPETTSHSSTTKSHRTTTSTSTTSQEPTTMSHNLTTTSHQNATVHPTTANSTTSHQNVTVHPTMANSTTSHQNVTVHPTMANSTTSHQNVTVHPTSGNSTTTTSSPHPGPPPPPSPSPSPGVKAIGDYMWKNNSQPCVRLKALIQIRVLYPTQDGKEKWGISVLNPNKTVPHGSCAHPPLLLSFPSGQIKLGFQEAHQSAVYLNYLAVEFNVSFPEATQWTFSAENSSLQDLLTPLHQSFICRNASIALSRTFHLDLLNLQLQAAQLPSSGEFSPSFSCPTDFSILLPLIIGLILLGLITVVLVIFCIVQRRPSAYQPL